MKNLFYFTFGILFTLIMLLFCVDNYGREFIQDYWTHLIYYGDLKDAWLTTKSITCAIFILYAVIFVFNLGKSANHKEQEEPEIKIKVNDLYE